MRFNIPNIVTHNGELFVGQKLFLLKGTKMKVVEVLEVCESNGSIHLVVEDQYNRQLIELSHPLGDLSHPIEWIIVSVPYIEGLVIERLKQHI